MSAEEKKPDLIIDEDWKAQVEREKAELEAKSASQEPPKPEAAKSEKPKQPLPPATLEMLVSALGTQALAAMGQFGPSEGNAAPDFDQAQHLIDLIEMLEAKTKGNRTDAESRLLDDMLHQLRMIFVQVRR